MEKANVKKEEFITIKILKDILEDVNNNRSRDMILTIPGYDSDFRDDKGLIKNVESFNFLRHVKGAALLQSLNEEDGDNKYSLCLASCCGPCDIEKMIEKTGHEMVVFKESIISGDKDLTSGDLFDAILNAESLTGDIENMPVTWMVPSLSDYNIIDDIFIASTAGIIAAIGDECLCFATSEMILALEDTHKIDDIITKSATGFKCTKVLF